MRCFHRAAAGRGVPGAEQSHGCLTRRAGRDGGLNLTGIIFEVVGQALCIGSEPGLLVDFLQRLTGLGIGEDAEVSDAVKARWQDMGQAAPDEFDG